MKWDREDRIETKLEPFSLNVNKLSCLACTSIIFSILSSFLSCYYSWDLDRELPKKRLVAEDSNDLDDTSSLSPLRILGDDSILLWDWSFRIWVIDKDLELLVLLSCFILSSKFELLSCSCWIISADCSSVFNLKFISCFNRSTKYSMLSWIILFITGGTLTQSILNSWDTFFSNFIIFGLTLSP